MNKQQLASKIWESANKLRSKIEANEYKDYILGFIFYKFLSDKEEQLLRKDGWEAEDLKELTEEDADTVGYCRRQLGYFISYDNLFSTWLHKGKDFDVSNVTDALSAFNRLIDPKHKKVFEKIFDTLDTGLTKLGDTSGARTKAISNLLQLIKDIPMDGKEDYDVLGFIYEYLISNFAANAGKKAGEFYTPHEVSLLMSEIVADHLSDRDKIEIYDPTSGSGSLLINIGQSAAKHMGSKDNIKYYAQELKENTYNLTRMNLVMRGILPDNIVTRNGDTLEEDWPFFDEEHVYSPLYVDAVVSNPPYSQHWEPTEDKKHDPRYANYGMAPKSKADYAFLLHDLFHLKPDGIMTIVLPHGVLFRGGEEGDIRRNLIEKNNIDAIIGLPANIFFGTGIPTIIMVLKQKRTNTDSGFGRAVSCLSPCAHRSGNRLCSGKTASKSPYGKRSACSNAVAAAVFGGNRHGAESICSACTGHQFFAYWYSVFDGVCKYDFRETACRNHESDGPCDRNKPDHRDTESGGAAGLPFDFRSRPLYRHLYHGPGDRQIQRCIFGRIRHACAADSQKIFRVYVASAFGSIAGVYRHRGLCTERPGAVVCFYHSRNDCSRSGYQ